MRKTLITITVAVLILLGGCAKDRAVMKPGTGEGDALFQKGKAYYEDENWGKAVKTLNEFTLSYPFHDKITEGTYLLADSYFQNEEYDLAAAEFRRLIRRFSESEYAEKAELMLAESYLQSAPHVALEQDDVRRALDLFQDFITYRPKSEYIDQARDGINRCRERLAEKEYNTVKLYYKLHKPDAVILYADLLADEYDGTSWVPAALLIKGKTLYEQLDQPKSALKVFQNIVENYPDTEYAGEASKHISKIKG